MYFEDVSDLWRESPREVVLPRVKMMRARGSCLDGEEGE